MLNVRAVFSNKRERGTFFSFAIIIEQIYKLSFAIIIEQTNRRTYLGNIQQS